MADFKPGDLVRLKSGGPLMTVRAVNHDDGDTTVFCDWFVQQDGKSGHFPPTSLDPAPAGGKRVVGVSSKPRGGGGTWMG